MTRQNRDGRASPFEEILNAQWARHEARMARAMAAHERATAAAELRMAGAMRAHERAMEALERRAQDVLRRDRGTRLDLPPRTPSSGVGQAGGRTRGRRTDARGPASKPRPLCRRAAERRDRVTRRRRAPG